MPSARRTSAATRGSFPTTARSGRVPPTTRGRLRAGRCTAFVANRFELGVEEELLFVDAETFEVAPGFSRVVGEGDERVKPELFESFVELTTPVLPDAQAVLAELRRAR